MNKNRMIRLLALMWCAGLLLALPACSSDDPGPDPTEQGGGNSDDNNKGDDEQGGGNEEDNKGNDEPGGGNGDEELPSLPFEYGLIITVAQDGSGDCTTVGEALGMIRNVSKYNIIRIKPGIYREKLTVSKNKIILYGEDPETTILTYDDCAGTIGSDGKELGTQGSASFTVNANDFMALNLTFENPHVNTTGTGDPAVAVGVFKDRAAFYNCRLLGYQDTFYPKNHARVYCKECYIEGNVDFIFGDAALVCENCTLCCNRNDSVLTAPATSHESKFGFVFMDCVITTIDGNDFQDKPISRIYLGRAWQQGPRAVFIRCEEPDCLAAAGWSKMNDTVVAALFAEYQCTGEGAAADRLSQRANGGRQLTDAEAAEYTLENIFAKESYQPTNSSEKGYAYLSDWMPLAPFTL